MGKFKVGDTVCRAVASRDEYWGDVCERFGFPPDCALHVTAVFDAHVQLNGEEGFLANPEYFDHWVPTPAATAAYDAVKRPKHYMLLDTEAITLIACGLTQEQFYGYCLGNAMKYRLRAGKKDDTLQDIGKAEEYELLYEQHKHLCRKGGTHHG